MFMEESWLGGKGEEALQSARASARSVIAVIKILVVVEVGMET